MLFRYILKLSNLGLDLPRGLFPSNLLTTALLAFFEIFVSCIPLCLLMQFDRFIKKQLHDSYIKEYM